MTSQVRTRAHLWVLIMTAAVQVGWGCFGCSHGSSSLPPYAQSQLGTLTGPTSTGDSCTANESKIECGNVVSQTPDYVVCAMGSRTCQNGTWGTCVASGPRQVKELLPAPRYRWRYLEVHLGSL